MDSADPIARQAPEPIHQRGEPDRRTGQAATAASALGPSRKGRPAISLEPGETATLADIDGPGVIRHIWMTVADKTPQALGTA